ncbi:hypothetical protein, partial [Brucella melitensis]|uniref:hypothetical protein n=1 Tax=Brucella melitensis TaxID=29459 RepID=UPI003891DB5F
RFRRRSRAAEGTQREETWRRRQLLKAPSFFVGDDDGDQEITPVSVAVPVLPKAHKEKKHGGDGNC